ncbi:MAG: hypothetical protein CL944_02065 [Candidatus Diapherotrites archaeon]|uniref:KaiC domain-containing protein n=1 Tax=Candidatus Iainarchaeum sp. TaxID=3101447 RepID=A0A2D6LPX7_9ARCH|nr:hypothetical protein [Candidatus Diapherotrites archaeon]|tara:strand:+ start:6717 stop:7931 length:1215 start_codon:yes stop_codon:yes gene_type:complete
MVENKQRLIDATKRLIHTGTSEEEAMKSMTDIGINEKEAKDIMEQAKADPKHSENKVAEKTAEKKPPSDGFWDSHDPLSKRENKSEKKASADNLRGDFWDSSGKSFFTPTKNEKPEKKQGFSILGKGDIPDFEGAEASLKPRSPGHYDYKKTEFRETVPVLVSDFDKLIDKGGLKRGDTILISGGAGTGKTTFGMQFIYEGAKLRKEKGVYLTLEETSEKIKENMMENFGWDLDALEKEGLLAIIKIDPLTIARAVEATLTKERGGLYIEFEKFDLPFQFDLPFKPERVVVDSLSALSIAFVDNHQGYRQYLRHLFETLEGYGSVNLVFGETEQLPNVYSRLGIEEFLADAVVVFYNIKIHNNRETALEILKLRSSAHAKKLVPYKITPRGFEIYIDQEIFRED